MNAQDYEDKNEIEKYLIEALDLIQKFEIQGYLKHFALQQYARFLTENKRYYEASEINNQRLMLEYSKNFIIYELLITPDYCFQ